MPAKTYIAYVQTNPPSELAQLKKQIAQLREQLFLMQQFIQISPADPARGIPVTARFRCHSLSVLEAVGPESGAASAPNAPGVQTQGSAGRPRIILEAQASPQCLFLSRDGEVAAEIEVDDETGRGRVSVLEAGYPRVTLKSIAEGGAVTVLHDDGRPRATLLGTEHNGAELRMITPDLTTGVKISSDGPHGGLITVNQASGKPGVAILCGPSSGGMLCYGQGGLKAALP